MRHPLVKEVNSEFVERFNQWRKPRNVGLRLLGDCMRRTWRDMKATEAGDPPNPAGMNNMSFGSAYELWIGERLKAANVLKFDGILGKDMQINIYLPHYQCNGYVDFLLKNDIPVEVKSCTSRRFNQLLKDRKPDKMHVYQLTAYMHFGGWKTKGYLIYIDRDKSYEDINGEYVPRWEVIEVPYNQLLGEKLEKRAARIAQYRREDQEPPKEPKDSTDPRCTWCPHRKHCWGVTTSSAKARGDTAATRIAAASKARRRTRASITSSKSAK